MTSPTNESGELGAVALDKLTRVLGPVRGQEVHRRLLEELQLDQVGTLGDLRRLAEVLQRQEGFERTVGAMLSVDVAMRELSAASRSPR